ncbi:unnamed protein product [marine sediment metagenome]|uniref:Uncharacterized protein n=1 Tax=marine sediment metagenome TaxID=412755 RepID=X1MVE3_9ZZZZ
MSIKIDLDQIVNGSDKQTNFTSGLLRLIFKADRHHTELLRKGFPNAVKAVEHYQTTGEILDLEAD